MAYLNLRTLKIPQPTIKVSVEFYNAEEGIKFRKYPTADKILELVEGGIEIPTEEFLTYYLFHKRRPGKPGWHNYREVSRQISRALAELADWVDFNGQSISTPRDIGAQERDITEHLGESIGMAVVNRIHGLTAADWDRIPSGAVRTFDYQVASDGQNIIQVEAKGSSTSDNQYKVPSVSAHKRSILEKKIQIAELENKHNYRYPANLRYGVITIVGECTRNPVRALLVDPPAAGDASKAQGFRLLQRMRFMSDWISFISPRSQLASALQTRLGALEYLADPLSLNNVPLKRGNGKLFSVAEPSFWGTSSSFFTSKATILGKSAGGAIFPLESGELFFVGIKVPLLTQAAKQNFDEILTWKSDTSSTRETIECRLSEGAFLRLRLSPKITEQAVKRGAYYHLRLSGDIHYSDSGILFGILPVKNVSVRSGTSHRFLDGGH